MADRSRQTPKYIYTNYANGVTPGVSNRVNPKKSKRYKRPLVLLVLLLIIIGVSWLLIPASTRDVKAKQVESIIHPEVKNTTTSNTASTQAFYNMQNQVNSIIQSNPDITFEIAITNMNDGSQVNFGTTGPMTAASVNKLVTASDFLTQVEKGDETMSETLEDGNHASSDLQQMIVVSSDSAWGALNDDLSYDQLQDYGDSLGLTSFEAAPNNVSARDIADLLTSLYQGKLLNSSDTQLLLGYMKQANYRQYVLPAVPSSDTVYHKIGLYSDNVNDATIITNGTQTISYVIFTDGNGTYDWPHRAVIMQEITKPILNYYGLS